MRSASEKRSSPFANQSGMTMIELMIYMSMVTIALVVMTSFIVDVSTNAAKTKTVKEVQQNARMIVSRISQDIRTAFDVVVDPTQTQLDILALDGSTIRSYQWDGQNLTDNGTKLNADGVRVNQPKFSEHGIAVTVEISVEQASTVARAAERASTTLISSVVPRPRIY